MFNINTYKEWKITTFSSTALNLYFVFPNNPKESLVNGSSLRKMLNWDEFEWCLREKEKIKETLLAISFSSDYKSMKLIAILLGHLL